jgi:hypothetical protein
MIPVIDSAPGAPSGNFVTNAVSQLPVEEHVGWYAKRVIGKFNDSVVPIMATSPTASTATPVAES